LSYAPENLAAGHQKNFSDYELKKPFATAIAEANGFSIFATI